MVLLCSTVLSNRFTEGMVMEQGAKEMGMVMANAYCLYV